MTRSQFAVLVGAAVALGASATALGRRMFVGPNPSSEQIDEASREVLRRVPVTWALDDDEDHVDLEAGQTGATYLVLHGHDYWVMRVNYAHLTTLFASGARLLAYVGSADESVDDLRGQVAYAIAATYALVQRMRQVEYGGFEFRALLARAQDAARFQTLAEQQRTGAAAVIDQAVPVPVQVPTSTTHTADHITGESTVQRLQGYESTIPGLNLEVALLVPRGNTAQQPLFIVDQAHAIRRVAEEYDGYQTLAYANPANTTRDNVALPYVDPNFEEPMSEFFELNGDAYGEVPDSAFELGPCASIRTLVAELLDPSPQAEVVTELAKPIDTRANLLVPGSPYADPRSSYVQLLEFTRLAELLNQLIVTQSLDSYCEVLALTPTRFPTDSDVNRCVAALEREFSVWPATFDDTEGMNRGVRRAWWSIHRVMHWMPESCDFEEVFDWLETAATQVEDARAAALIVSALQYAMGEMIIRCGRDQATGWISGASADRVVYHAELAQEILSIITRRFEAAGDAIASDDTVSVFWTPSTYELDPDWRRLLLLDSITIQLNRDRVYPTRLGDGQLVWNGSTWEVPGMSADRFGLAVVRTAIVHAMGVLRGASVEGVARLTPGNPPSGYDVQTLYTVAIDEGIYSSPLPENAG